MLHAVEHGGLNGAHNPPNPTDLFFSLLTRCGSPTEVITTIWLRIHVGA